MCDGWLKRLCTTGNYINGTVPVGGFTSANILTNGFAQALGLATPEMLVNPANMQFKVSADVAAYYRIATASQNNVTNVTEGLALTYLDIPVVVEYGLPANTIYKSIEVSEYFFEAMQQNFDIVSGENKKIIGIDKKYIDLYNSLEDTEFHRKDAIKKAKDFNIGQRMCCNFLKNNDYFKRTSYGKYLKILEILEILEP